MRWRGRRRSTRIDDRRGRAPARRGVAVGGLGGLVLLLVAVFVFGVDPVQLLQQTSGPSVSVDGRLPSGPGSAGRDDLAEFVSVVLADTEETWTRLLEDGGRRYELPTLVLFDDAVDSACGFNSAAVGPFYCPADRRIYIDLAFFSELDRRFGAPGDFAQAYIVAHEVGHHVQNVLGISDEVRRQQRRSRSRANELSVRLELQADCLAGVWGYHANRHRRMLEPGDVEEGLRAAASIGDDRMQRMAGRRISPESWTHGSSEQRVTWLRRGLESGDIAACSTF